jgi:hypothetical protein
MATPRDETSDWIVPDGAVPTIGELESRIEVAISIARSSEAAAITVADAALESAQQARRAAELAERAALIAVSGRPAADPVPQPATLAPVPIVPAEAEIAPEREGDGGVWPPEEWLLDFSRRADQLGARFAKLTRV